MPVSVRRTLATVKSSANIPRQPDVPNLMAVFCFVSVIPLHYQAMAPRKSATSNTVSRTPNTDARSKFCIVLTTMDKPELAHHFAEALVKKKLAACVNIVPNIKSVYRWKDKIETANEFLLLIKTTQLKIDSLETEETKIHLLKSNPL